MTTTRMLCVGGVCVAVAADGEPATDMVQFLFGSIPSSPWEAPVARLQVTELVDEDGYILREDDAVIFKSESIELLAGILVERALFHFAAHCTDGPMIHAAAVSLKGQAFLIPGQSGRGKTTLTTWLLHRGFSYLSDELVCLTPGCNTIQGFSRPLNIKLPSLSVLEQATGRDLNKARVVKTQNGVLVSPHSFGCGGVVDQASLDAIIFPSYKAEAKHEVIQLPKGQAAVLLMECLVNARNLEGHGFKEITRLARALPAYEIHYQSFAELDQSFSELTGTKLA